MSFQVDVQLYARSLLTLMSNNMMAPHSAGAVDDREEVVRGSWPEDRDSGRRSGDRRGRSVSSALRASLALIEPVQLGLHFDHHLR